MFVIDSSRISLLGRPITYYLILPILGTLVLIVLGGMFARKKGFSVNIAIRLNATVFFGSIILLLQLSRIPAQIKPFMFASAYIFIILLYYLVACFLKQPVILMLQLAVISMQVYFVFSKLGCFFTGCCYGYPCSGFCSVTYGTETLCEMKGIKLVPIQLITATVFLILAAFSMYMYSKINSYLTIWLQSCITIFVYYFSYSFCNPMGARYMLKSNMSYIMSSIAGMGVLCCVLIKYKKKKE